MRWSPCPDVDVDVAAADHAGQRRADAFLRSRLPPAVPGRVTDADADHFAALAQFAERDLLAQLWCARLR
jgi:hypothetical protein